MTIYLMPHLDVSLLLDTLKGVLTIVTRSSVSPASVVYDSVKVVVAGLINMTDGLPWPWKAIPQTVMQFVLQAEVRRDVPYVSHHNSHSRDIQHVLDQPAKIKDLINRMLLESRHSLQHISTNSQARAALEHAVQMFLRFVAYSTRCGD